jgi:hypothetical protein
VLDVRTSLEWPWPSNTSEPPTANGPFPFLSVRLTHPR